MRERRNKLRPSWLGRHREYSLRSSSEELRGIAECLSVAVNYIYILPLPSYMDILILAILGLTVFMSSLLCQLYREPYDYL